MRVCVAMDSFKGSLTSLVAGESVADGIKTAFPQSDITVLPVADGGEGTVTALVSFLGGEIRTITALDPLGRSIKCSYGVLKDNTAVIEMCAAAGLTLLTNGERNPLNTTTYGVGQLILHAAESGCRNFIIGIGGSATNDGGAGMLEALGVRFLDKNNNPVSRGAKGLNDIETINLDGLLPVLSECSFKIACDVKNPLCGDNGCSKIFGIQKGADLKTAEIMDNALEHYAEKVKSVLSPADKNFPGAGAAGGMGFAFKTFLNGELVGGIDLVAKLTKMEDIIKNCDYVVTGEGRIDGQSVMGKVPVGVATIAKKYSKPVVAFCGSLAKGWEKCNNYGIDAIFSILNEPCDLSTAMNSEYAVKSLTATAEQVFRIINQAGKSYED